MRRCAFLTMEDLGGHVSDDDLAVEAFEEQGWLVDWVPWLTDADWSRYEAVLIRSTWDYHESLDKFLTVLESIASKTCLINPLELVRWNARKTYLDDLRRHGIETVPTRFERTATFEDVESYFAYFGTEIVVVKPVVGAGARSTYVLRQSDAEAEYAAIAETLGGAPFMVQPFVPSVVDDGEYSLLYFGGAFSHAVVKTPKARDFRVQEEHGGTIVRTDAEPDLRMAAQRAMDVLDRSALYARADFVRSTEGVWMLMELELIEPSLYLRTDTAAAHYFAGAFDRWMQSQERFTRKFVL